MQYVQEAREFIVENWFKAQGLFAALVLELVTIPWLIAQFPFGGVGIGTEKVTETFITFSIVVTGVVMISTIYSWLFHRYPKSNIDKINIGVCINIEDPAAKLAYKDFIAALRRFVMDSDTDSLFNVVVYPAHVSKTVTSNSEALSFGKKNEIGNAYLGKGVYASF